MYFIRWESQWVFVVLEVNSRWFIKTSASGLYFITRALRTLKRKWRVCEQARVLARILALMLVYLSLKVLYLKCDSKLKDPHFNSWTLIYRRTSRNENWTFSWGSPFSKLFGWFTYTKDLVRKTYFGILSTDFGFKIQPVDRIYIIFASRKNISCTPCTPKISFLNTLNRKCGNSKYIQVI